jgi:hypothetical protein
MSRKYLVAVVLLLSALWTCSALAKIERFKDEQGTLHIRNNGEGEPAAAPGIPGAAPVHGVQQATPHPGVQPPPPPPIVPRGKLAGQPNLQPAVPEPEPDDSGDDEAASDSDDSAPEE